MSQLYGKQNKNVPKKMGFDFYIFIYISQPSSMFEIGNFENTISIHLLNCNREFTFCRSLMCSAISFISYKKDGTIGVTQILDPKNWE